MSKLSLRGKVASNKVSLCRWVEPSFGEHLGNANLSLSSGIGGIALSGGTWVGKASTDPNSNKRLRKRRAEPNASELQTSTFTEPSLGDQDEPWVDTHKPHSQAELAVHKKKIEEVEDWMRVHVDPKTGGAVLLLTGPSGCGKSATVQVLAQELGYRVQEWSNPSNPDTYRQTFDPGEKNPVFNGFYGSSQTGLFQEFLLRANKYNRLQMSGEGGASDSDRKLILVEVLFCINLCVCTCSSSDRRFVKTCRRPLLFIVSDSLSGDSSSRLLFPKHVQEELGVCNIRYFTSGGKMCVPDKAALELLCSGSSGDIRSAINSLQFSCLTGEEHHTYCEAWGWKHHALGLFFCKGTRTTDLCKGKNEWGHSRSTMGEYGSSVATRGLLHSNSGHVAGGFRPLHKPNWLLVNKKYRENCQAAQSLFISFCLTSVSLQTELLPYLAQLSNPLRNPAQIAFIQDVGCLSRRKLPGRLKLEALTDKDPGLLELDSEEEGGLVSSSVDPTSGTLSGETGDQGDPSLEPLLPGSQGPVGDLPASQPQPTTTSALLEEEDVVIEEYDSDF
uniref:RAD17 checkpoint clamp loader component n=1 Tax=Hucho hucho TaxID=62062 RepID=A0A4W5L1Z0_9TELE